MKRALLFFSLLLGLLNIANAQFNPANPYAQVNNACGQIFYLQGGNFYQSYNLVSIGSTLPTCLPPVSTANFNGGVISGTTINATTQAVFDNSTLVATDAFAKQSILAASATIPITNVTGGTYNFATTGTGAQIVVLASGGTITGILTVATPGINYQVGDCIVMVGGTGDAILRVTAVSSGGITTAAVLYGGTGYSTGAQLAGMSLPPGSRTGLISGTLTSNALIIIPAGSYLQGGRRIGFSNNTTGAFTTTVKLSNGAGGSTGTGVLLPQGTANSTSMLLYTDGVNDVWNEANAFSNGVTCSGSPTASFATVNGVVTHC
jgi:hypothetical protein